MHGLQPFAVLLSPSDPAWARRAELESTRLRAVLGNALLAVHHIGSTAIPGIDAKPVIDLLPVVQTLADFDHARSSVEGLGYRAWGESGIDGRRYCTLNNSSDGRREVQLHVFAEGSPHIVRHIAFRDFMRAVPEEARAYEAEKRRCRDLHPNDSHAYSEAKSAWVRRAEQRALAWHASRQA